MAEFNFPCCNQRFEVEWTYGDDVQCPGCGKQWKTDYDFSIDPEEGEMLMGPWLDGPVEDPEKAEG